jgi:heme exporter protein C
MNPIVPRPAITRTAAWLWFFAALAVLAIGFRQAIFVAPTEATMGDVQRIFYYHVPSAMMGLVFPYVNFIASLAYLYWRRRDPLKALTADALALASAEVTIVFVSIGLATGMLWGRASWGIWWTWDARLTTYLLLWLLYVSYLLLRRFSSTAESQTLAAVISVFAAVDVPIVFMSIKWWRTQHPSPVFSGDGSLDASMWPAFLFNLAGWAMWGAFVMLFRFALERRRQLEEQDNALLAIEASMETPQ